MTRTEKEWVYIKSLLIEAGIIANFQVELQLPLEEDAGIYGCYIEGSVLDGTAEIMVNEKLINKRHAAREARDYHIRVTLGHELAHSFSDLITLRYPNFAGLEDSPLNFNRYFFDEEDFAETFGMCLTEGSLREYPFWQEFIPLFNELSVEYYPRTQNRAKGLSPS